MGKKEEILNLVLKYLDNISDEELYNAFMNRGKYEMHSIGCNTMKLEIKGIEITLKEQIDLLLKAKYNYSIDFFYDKHLTVYHKYLTIYDKRIKIYFDRLRNYIAKINIEEENQNINNILSRLKL